MSPSSGDESATFGEETNSRNGVPFLPSVTPPQSRVFVFSSLRAANGPPGYLSSEATQWSIHPLSVQWQAVSVRPVDIVACNLI